MKSKFNQLIFSLILMTTLGACAQPLVNREIAGTQTNNVTKPSSSSKIPVLKPHTTPQISTQAMGGIATGGGITHPYTPTEDFSYQCLVKLEDSDGYKEIGDVLYQHYSEQTIILDQTNSKVGPVDIPAKKWTHIREAQAANATKEVVNEVPSYPLTNHFLELSWGIDDKNVSVNLRAAINLNKAPHIDAASSDGGGDFSSKSIYSSVSATPQGKTNSLTLRVRCLRTK